MKSCAFKIRQTYDFETVQKLNDKILPEDPLKYDDRYICWLVYHGKRPVGFCVGRNINTGENSFYLSRAGLLSCAQGHGLHKRLIRVRVNYAKKHGYDSVITYVERTNAQSFSNLEKCGFRLYVPDEDWAGKSFIYFRKEF